MKAHLTPLAPSGETASALSINWPPQDNTNLGQTEAASSSRSEPAAATTGLDLPELEPATFSISAADLAEPLSGPDPIAVVLQEQQLRDGSSERETQPLTFSFAQPEEPLNLFWRQLAAEEAVRIAQSAPAESAPEPTAEPNEAELEEFDPELGIIRIRAAAEDPELGIIRIREQPFIPDAAAPAAAPTAYLTGRLSVLNSGNIFLALDPAQGLIGDQVIRPGLSLGIYPALAQETYLLAVADVNFQRYFNVGSANYDELRLRLGIRQGLTPRSYAQASWSHQALFRPGIRDRFFTNDSFELLLARRDPITPELAINTYYQVQLNLSNPQSFDRLIQFAGVYASYQFTPQLQAGLNYQFTLADYTAFERFDTYQQLIGQLIYQVTPAVRVSLFGGLSFGRSSVPTVRFEDAILGISIEGTVPLF